MRWCCPPSQGGQPRGGRGSGSEPLLPRAARVVRSTSEQVSADEPGVLLFGLHEDGYVRVRVFPEGEEVLIGFAGLGQVARKLHQQKRLTFVFVDILNRADVRMVQRRRRASLPRESSSALGSFLATSSGRNFSATGRPSRVSSALYTTPMPPPPIRSSTR